MATIDDLRNVIDQTCEACKLLANDVGINGENFESGARVELACFMMYLSASDHTIRTEEAALINKLCKVDLSPSEINQFISMQNIYSTEFEEKVPASLQLMVMGDKILDSKGAGMEGKASRSLIELYKVVGQVMTQVDGEESDEEKVDYNIYIDMMEKYRKENYSDAKPENDNKKDVGDVAAPMKNTGSVKAPRKG